jgi:tetratricopeptide (TPR) repeat protein
MGAAGLFCCVQFFISNPTTLREVDCHLGNPDHLQGESPPAKRFSVHDEVARQCDTCDKPPPEANDGLSATPLPDNHFHVRKTAAQIRELPSANTVSLPPLSADDDVVCQDSENSTDIHIQDGQVTRIRVLPDPECQTAPESSQAIGLPLVSESIAATGSVNAARENPPRESADPIFNPYAVPRVVSLPAVTAEEEEPAAVASQRFPNQFSGSADSIPETPQAKIVNVAAGQVTPLPTEATDGETGTPEAPELSDLATDVSVPADLTEPAEANLPPTPPRLEAVEHRVVVDELSQTVSAPAEPPGNGHVTVLSASPEVEERVRQHIDYGKSLARRGSTFAAREEFVRSLRMIAESYDMQTQGRACTESLAAGLRALAESDDFVAVDSRQQLDMDLQGILETHHTRLIDPATSDAVSPIEAMQTYYAFASEQLAGAVGQSAAASDALHALGKLMTTAARFDATGKPQDRTKAMVMHQVALMANSSNHRSANELGVLLARHGRWPQALKLFSQSLQIRPTAAAWKNIATTHQKLAERSADPRQRQLQQELARLALQEFRTLESGSTLPDASLADALPSSWATPDQFGDRAAMPEVEGQARVTASASDQTDAQRTGRGLFKNIKDWF